LGKSTAKILAEHGATVVMACRSQKRCSKAADDIINFSQKPKTVDTMILDLGDLHSVSNFAKEFQSKYKKLDTLILNAGIMLPPNRLTKDGIESQFGVNHVGHFYLTKLLMSSLEQAQPSTVVSVSSNAHFNSYPLGVHLTLEGVNDEATYNPSMAYGQSKLCNVLFAQELAERCFKFRWCHSRLKLFPLFLLLTPKIAVLLPEGTPPVVLKFM
jgi:NAD(P)-dependent dehydrogenase (short-subunit alcohol dehydrogenase family)